MNFATIAGAAVYPPASAESIAALAGQLPAVLPEEYATLLTHTDGLTADHFALYPCSDLPERNATFEVAVYAPGFIIIGGDGGGSAIVMRGGPGPSPIFTVGHGTMQPADMVRIADSLTSWLAAGGPLDE